MLPNIADRLTTSGVGRTDPTVLYLPTCARWIFLIWGSSSSGTAKHGANLNGTKHDDIQQSWTLHYAVAPFANLLLLFDAVGYNWSSALKMNSAVLWRSASQQCSFCSKGTWSSHTSFLSASRSLHSCLGNCSSSKLYLSVCVCLCVLSLAALVSPHQLTNCVFAYDAAHWVHPCLACYTTLALRARIQLW